MKKVPLWIVASLGKMVRLKTDFVGPCETYLRGCEGVLVSVMCDQDTGALYAILALDKNDPSYFENFTFDQVEPSTDRITFTLDIEEGFIEF